MCLFVIVVYIICNYRIQFLVNDILYTPGCYRKYPVVFMCIIVFDLCKKFLEWFSCLCQARFIL